MGDEFDRFLAAALAPVERLPDREFVARVQATIALEDMLAAQRRSLVANLARQLLALSAVGGAVWWVVRAAPVAGWFAASPALGLGVLLTGFAFLIAVFSFRSGADAALSLPLRAISAA